MAKKEVNKKENLAEKKKVAKSPFILALIGGILYVILAFLLYFSYHFVSVQITNNPDIFTNIAEQQGLTSVEIERVASYFSMLSWISLSVFLIFGIGSLVGSFLMKKERTMKAGGITSLVVGILSVNVLTIIAGSLGIAFSTKNK